MEHVSEPTPSLTQGGAVPAPTSSQNPQAEKICSKCGQPGEFRKGHRQCSECERTRSREGLRVKRSEEGYAAKIKAYKAVHKRQERQTQQRLLAARQIMIDKIKGVPCLDCGHSYPSYVMDFDHRDPSTKLFDVARIKTSTRRWSVVLEEMAKCDVVCARCHRMRTWTQPKNRYRDKARDLRIRLKAVPCLDCGGIFHYCQMEFDHVRGDKIAPIANLRTEASILAEASKCDVVCTNCHRLRTQAKGQFFQRRAVDSIDMNWRYNSRNNLLGHAVVGREKKLSPDPRSWHALVGTMPDNEVATIGEISRSVVTAFRVKQGIARHPRRKAPPKVAPWHALVGTMTDQEVSDIAGVSFSYVAEYRRQIGVPSFRSLSHGKLQVRDWHERAGKVPDREVASQAGITVQSVCKYRKRMGIPRFQKDRTEA